MTGPALPGAGGVIRWTHYAVDGARTQRVGLVWCGGPTVAKAGRTVWVTPDVRLPTDILAAVLVAASNSPNVRAHGPTVRETREVKNPHIMPGCFFGSDHRESPLGRVARAALSRMRSWA